MFFQLPNRQATLLLHPTRRSMQNDIEIIDASRSPLTFPEMRKMMSWSWGDRGVWAADLWRKFNEAYWGGQLEPVPIWFPQASPYGHWVGLCSGNRQGQTQHIQLLRGKPDDFLAHVLLHEMIHQYLFETGQNPAHNAQPWCEEVMRLTKQIWGKDIWVSPSVPRKVDGKSQRIQKRSPARQESIPLKEISGWPHSLNLTLPMPPSDRERLE